MEHRNSSDTDGSLDSKETVSVFSNPQVHYRVHTSQPLFPTPSHINSVHTFIYHFFYNYFNIILPSTSSSSKRSLSYRCPHQNPVCISSPHTFHMPRPYHPPRADRPNNTSRKAENFGSFSPVSCHFPPLMPK